MEMPLRWLQIFGPFFWRWSYQNLSPHPLMVFIALVEKTSFQVPVIFFFKCYLDWMDFTLVFKRFEMMDFGNSKILLILWIADSSFMDSRFISFLLYGQKQSCKPIFCDFCWQLSFSFFTFIFCFRSFSSYGYILVRLLIFLYIFKAMGIFLHCFTSWFRIKFLLCFHILLPLFYTLLLFNQFGEIFISDIILTLENSLYFLNVGLLPAMPAGMGLEGQYEVLGIELRSSMRKENNSTAAIFNDPIQFIWKCPFLEYVCFPLTISTLL